MLYYLTDSLIVDITDSLYQQIYRTIRTLGEAAESSTHLLYGDIGILEKAKEWFGSDPILSPLFNKLVENFSINIIPEFITYYIEVVKDTPVDNRTEGGVTIAQMKYTDLMTAQNVIKADLISEDINDCCFYKYILGWYMKENNIIANVQLDDKHGGGGRTEAVIRGELRKKHVSICIIDTDKKHTSFLPDNNSTYGKCKGLGKRSPFYKFLPIDVHEIENLIPTNFIDMLNIWNTDACRQNKEYFDYLKNDAERILPFFDFKKGIRKTNDLKNDIAYYNYAKHCYNQNPRYYEINPDFNSYYEEKNDNEVIYVGLINGLLAKVLALLKESGYIEPILYHYQLSNWNMISQHMLNWGIARNNESLY